MKEIIALQEYTDKYVSLYEGEIRNIQDRLADKLIEKGIVAEHSDSEDGEDPGEKGIIYVNMELTIDGGERTVNYDSTETLRFDDIKDLIDNGQMVFLKVQSPGNAILYYSLNQIQSNTLIFSNIAINNYGTMSSMIGITKNEVTQSFYNTPNQ